jgi:hypothetical protein
MRRSHFLPSISSGRGRYSLATTFSCSKQGRAAAACAGVCTRRMPRPIEPLSSFRMKVGRAGAEPEAERVLAFLPSPLPLPPLLLTLLSCARKASVCSGSRKVRGWKS